jgi:hypothetical protein
VTVQVSPLAAHRLARGWTLAETAAEIAELRAGPGSGPTVTAQMLCAWERGRVTPSLSTVTVLCQLYQAGPEQLGFGGDYAAGRTAAGTPGAPGGLDETLDRLDDSRRTAEDLLESLAAPPGHRDELRARCAAVAGYGVTGEFGTLPQLLARVVEDLVAIQALLTPRLSTGAYQHTCHALARLATLAAMALSMQGRLDEARSWFRSARAHARASGDPSMVSWTLSYEALLPLFTDRPRTALALSRAAREAGHGSVSTTPSAALIWALDTEARALARLGHRRAAELALHRTRTAFERYGPDADVDRMYGYPERHLHWCEAEVHAHLGNTPQAWRALARTGTDARAAQDPAPAMIMLTRALCLLTDGEIAEGCRAAEQAVAVAPAHFLNIVRANVPRLLSTVPPRYRLLGCVVDLRGHLEGGHDGGHDGGPGPATTTHPVRGTGGLECAGGTLRRSEGRPPTSRRRVGPTRHHHDSPGIARLS